MKQITLTSPSFENMHQIPAKHTCEGIDISPELVIKAVPPGTVSLAIIVDDPDAPVGTFDHWIAWNISPKSEVLPERFIPPGQGMNHFGEFHYRGPCPPKGRPHHYHFKVFALDRMIDLPEGSSRRELEEQMNGHLLATGELIGLYQR